MRDLLSLVMLLVAPAPSRGAIVDEAVLSTSDLEPNLPDRPGPFRTNRALLLR